MVLTLTTIVNADKIDDKNELILQKILELDDVEVTNVEISNNNIFVSIEVTDAMGYDTELISYWGSILGTSAMLKNNNISYSTVIIENLVDGEPYLYVSTNVVSIQDYQNNLIEDYEFWEESLVTAKKPTTHEVIEGSYLPLESLRVANVSAKSHSTAYIWWVVVFILLLFVVITFKNIFLHTKQKFFVAKNTLSKQTKHVSTAVQKHTKKGVAHTKHFYNTKGKKALNNVHEGSKKTLKKVSAESKKLSKTIVNKSLSTHKRVKKKLTEHKKNN